MPRPQTASSLVAMAAYPTNLNEDLPKQLVTSEGTEKESLPLRLYQNELEYVQALECVSTVLPSNFVFFSDSLLGDEKSLR